MDSCIAGKTRGVGAKWAAPAHGKWLPDDWMRQRLVVRISNGPPIAIKRRFGIFSMPSSYVGARRYSLFIEAERRRSPAKSWPSFRRDKTVAILANE